MENLDINVDDVVYVGPYYYMEDKNGIHDMDWTAFWAMAIVWLLIVNYWNLHYFFPIHNFTDVICRHSIHLWLWVL